MDGIAQNIILICMFLTIGMASCSEDFQKEICYSLKTQDVKSANKYLIKLQKNNDIESLDNILKDNKCFKVLTTNPKILESAPPQYRYELEIEEEIFLVSFYFIKDSWQVALIRKNKRS